MSKFLLLIGLFIIPSRLLAGGFYEPRVNLSQAQPDTHMVKGLLDELDDIINKGNYALARQKIQKLKEWSDVINYDYGKASAALNLAQIYLNEQHFDSAEVLLLQVIDSYDTDRING